MSEIDKSVMQDPQTSEVAGHRPVPLATEREQRVRQQRENGRWLLKLAIQPLLFLSAGALLIAGLGTAQRLGWMSAGGTAGHKQVANSDKNAQYICPMMCTPPQPEPGRCPVCGMELVSTSSGATGGDSRSIQIDPAARRLANIQTVAVKSIPLMRSIRAIGELSYDEGTLKTISAYVDGRIEKLYADYTGVVVTKGDRLALLYSPQLYSGQVELLLAKKAHDDQQNITLRRVIESNAELYESARQRLLELGMTGPQIDEIEATGQANSRMYLHAPISGTVIERFAVEGEYVKEGKVIFRLAGLSTVWLMLELFPEDAANIHYGQIVNTRVQSLPGREFTGRVAFIDPNVDPKTRTVGVRVVMPNEDGLLRVGDYANATICVAAGHEGGHSIAVYDPELARKWISPRHPHVIESSPGKCRVCGVDLVPASQFGFSDEPVAGDVALVVPRQAVLMAGANSVVYVETESGRFEIRRVVLGPNVGQQTVVLEGVREGELVASSGNFLIDSQMQLAGNPSLIDPTKSRATETDETATERAGALAKLSEEDRRLAEQQGVCPVTDYPLGAMGPPVKVDVGGVTVFLCCEGCRQAMVDSPQKYLSKLTAGDRKADARDAGTETDLPPIGLPEIVESDGGTLGEQAESPRNEEAAKIAAALAALPPGDRLLARQQRVCPVADSPLGLMGTPIKMDVNGRAVFICCESCRERLLAEPQKYLAKLPKEAIQ